MQILIQGPGLRLYISNKPPEFQGVSSLTEGPLSLSKLKKPPGLKVLSPSSTSVSHTGPGHC